MAPSKPINSDSTQTYDVVVVGAGISGIAAARALQHSGARVAIIEKSRGLGGRLATRRSGEGTSATLADTGAQFTYIRSPEWAELLRQDPQVIELPRTEQIPHPRYIHPEGLSRIVRILLPEVETSLLSPIRRYLEHRVTSFSLAPETTGGWRIHCESKEATERTILKARALVLSPPLPQTIDLLATAGIADARPFRDLSSISYSRCLALIATLDGASGLDRPGFLENLSGEIGGVFDQGSKGLNNGQPLVVAHASSSFSEKWWDQEPEIICAQLWELTRTLLPQQPKSVDLRLHRWRYAKPNLHLDSAYTLAHFGPNQSPLGICGDAFRASGADGAFDSGNQLGLAIGAQLSETAASE